MTQVEPGRLNSDVRECRLYRFYVLHPLTGERVLGYIGETIREPFDRLMEHIARQPWADTIVGWEVDGRVFATKELVVAAEKAAVERERPLYNDEFNRGNPDRILLEDAKRQRWDRDDAAGKPRWRPGRPGTMVRHGQVVAAPEQPSRRPYGEVSGNVRSRPVVSDRRRWTPGRKRLLCWGIAWAAVTLGLWVLEWKRPEDVRWWVAPCVAASLVGFTRLWSWLDFPIRKRTWHKQINKKRRKRR